MGLTKIKKGLSIPLAGEPKQIVHEDKFVKTVALIGFDYNGLKPTMKVEEGDKVKLGQVLFTDKKCPEVFFTSPVAGIVKSINRGEKRVFQSIIIEAGGNDEVTFDIIAENKINDISREEVLNRLLQSGLWTSIKERPFGKVPDPKRAPHSIFITAIDTNPLAPDMAKVIEGNEKDILNGALLLSKLTEGKVFICKSPEIKIPDQANKNIFIENFEGPHPAGNAGTHIHFLDPVSRNKYVWHLNVQDAAAIGKLFTTGRIWTDRIISLAGPQVNNPRLIKTKIGASIDEITAGELKEGENRIISGSVLSGRKSENPLNFLGRFHQQISVIEEVRTKEFLGWLKPGSNLYSAKNIVLSSLIGRNRKFNLSSLQNGGERAIVPNGSYEKVMPMDIIITYLLRSLAVNDIEEAEKLGALELDEEDLSLCTFVCPSKIDHSGNLRRNLNLIEKEG